MIPYSKISSKLIKPYQICTSSPNAKRYFFGWFGGDEKSFRFLVLLIRYCCEFNKGEWLERITAKILERMSTTGNIISVEETKIFTDGYIVKDDGEYELTHEFIVSLYLCCPDGNFFPLSTGHIDFAGEEKIAISLKDQIGIDEPQAVTFLTKLAIKNGQKTGTLIDRKLNLKDLVQIARDNNLIFDLCIDWAIQCNLLFVDMEEEIVVCNTLMIFTYLVSPKLH